VVIEWREIKACIKNHNLLKVLTQAFIAIKNENTELYSEQSSLLSLKRIQYSQKTTVRGF
jgi:hypothetical protein